MGPGGSPAGHPDRQDSGFKAPDEAFVAPDFFEPEVDCMRRVEDADRYREAFIAAFGTRNVSDVRVEAALDAYCRSIRSGRSAYDRFVDGDPRAISAAAQRGLALFRGKAGCATCHTMEATRATFTDQAVHNLRLEHALADERPLHPVKPPAFSVAELGAKAAAEAAENDARLRRWKTPTLRDVAKRGPYFHTGLAATLEDAIRTFRPPDSTPGSVPADAKWTDGQVFDVAEFLRSLSSEERPGLAASVFALRSVKTRLRFLDADGKSLPHFDVTLVPAGDGLPLHGDRKPTRVVSSQDGCVTFEPPLFTHVRVERGGGLQPIGGPLVPDTCRTADLKFPVRGHARLTLTLPSGRDIPPTLVAKHPGAKVFPDRQTPTTVLRLEGTTTLSKGAVAARYAAPLRTDVPAEAVVELPAPFGERKVEFRREIAVPLDLAP